MTVGASTWAFLLQFLDLGGEGRDGLEGILLPFSMRAMAASGQHQPSAGPGNPGLDSIQLSERRVLVLVTLDEQQRCGNSGKAVLDVPVAERLVQPGVMPPGEGGGGIAMMSRQPLRQAATAKSLTSASNAFDR